LTKNLDGVKATKKQEVSSTPDYMGPLLIDNDWYRKVKTIMSITGQFHCPRQLESSVRESL
jgi:hypothetical protein